MLDFRKGVAIASDASHVSGASRLRGTGVNQKLLYSELKCSFSPIWGNNPMEGSRQVPAGMFSRSVSRTPFTHLEVRELSGGANCEACPYAEPPKKSHQEQIAGNADNARSQICQVRSQTIACQSLSAG